MKNISFWSVLCLLFSVSAYAEDFYIEDESLVQVPSAAEKAIRSSGDQELSKCQFIGKTVDLDGDKKAGDLIVTTKNQCLWAAAAGPIWVLKGSDAAYSVALHFVSYSFELSTHMTNGLKDITLTRGAAAYADVVVWAYDGEKYNKLGSYHFDANDADACKANPDICPFAIED